MRSHSKPTSSGAATGRALALAALGVVYGDIGTSPLYALRECVHGPHAVGVDRASVVGVLSLILWSLLIVITLKYLVLVMRADNEGEGGILALAALVSPAGSAAGRRGGTIAVLGLFGAALLYGDGMITPAISVLSAFEGLEVVTAAFDPWVEPMTLVVLAALFLFQSRGTARIGAVFGPVMVIWFGCIGILGGVAVARNPLVLAAANPVHGARFLLSHGWHGVMILGVVFLVVTGGEALYADMGHFGKQQIRLAWFSVVLPGLLLSYFGQGALLLARPECAVNPFYNLAPRWAMIPLVILAVVATVIASQAVISGAFSLTLQAVQLGYLPRLEVRHTSAEAFGQIYVPFVNWVLLVCSAGLVLGFRSSSNMAAAYGVAVTTTMMITTLLLYFAMTRIWLWPKVAAMPVALSLLSVDLAFFTANIVKVPDGGWFPLLVGLTMVVVMSTWRQGRRLVVDAIRARSASFEELFEELTAEPPMTIAGAEVYLVSDADRVPPALRRNLRHFRVLAETVVVLNVQLHRRPRVPATRRVEIERLRNGFYRVVLHYGFMEHPNAPADDRPARLRTRSPRSRHRDVRARPGNPPGKWPAANGRLARQALCVPVTQYAWGHGCVPPAAGTGAGDRLPDRAVRGWCDGGGGHESEAVLGTCRNEGGLPSTVRTGTTGSVTPKSSHSAALRTFVVAARDLDNRHHPVRGIATSGGAHGGEDPRANDGADSEGRQVPGAQSPAEPAARTFLLEGGQRFATKQGGHRVTLLLAVTAHKGVTR